MTTSDADDINPREPSIAGAQAITSEISDSQRDGYGFFCRIQDQRHFQRITDKVRKQGYFTDRVLFDRVTVRLSDLILVVSPVGILQYAAHVRPSRNGTTGNRAFRAESIVELEIAEAELESALSEESWLRLREGMELPSFRPIKDDWILLWNVIKGLRPNQEQHLRRLEQLRFDRTFKFDDEQENGEQHFLEKDAIGITLDMAGIEFHGVFAEVADGLDKGQTLLESLCGNTTEDVQINHDVRNFPGFILKEDFAHGVKMTQGTREVTIYNVNRRPGERALGVDLIYKNVVYGSLVFVQYKMLEMKGGKGNLRWTYRPDQQFHDEVKRMRKARTDLTAHRVATQPNQFRLATDPFFLKFCRRQHLKVNAGMLAHGHYLNLSHVDILLSNPSGPRGGVVLSLSSMERWLTRSQFAGLVGSGWVGSVNVSDADLMSYIDQTLEQGNSVIYAEGSNLRDDDDNEW